MPRKKLRESTEFISPLVHSILSLCCSLRNRSFVLWTMVKAVSRLVPVSRAQDVVNGKLERVGDKLRYVLVRDGKLWFYVNPSLKDIYTVKLYHEPKISRVILGKNPSTFLDIGAHVGTYAIRFANRGCMVVAVEADPRNYAYLKANVAANKVKDNIGTYNFLAYSRRSTMTFYLRKEANLSSIFRELEYYKKIHVKACPVDVLADKLRKIDLLLIDAEGSEIDVLKGARLVLRKTHTIIIEVAEKNKQTAVNMLNQHRFNVTHLFKRDRVGMYYLGRTTSKDRSLRHDPLAREFSGS